MSNPLLMMKDLADLTVVVAASASVAVTAGGAGDNAAVVGLTIDRQALTPYGALGAVPSAMPMGAMFVVTYDATLTANATISIKNAIVQDSADGATWATIFDQTGVAAEKPATWPVGGVVDTNTGTATLRGAVALGSSIQRARRYIRFGFTPDLSAANTDTAKIAVCAVLSGFDELPPGVV